MMHVLGGQAVQPLAGGDHQQVDVAQVRALSVLVGQLPTLLGFSTGTDDVVTGIGRLVRGVADGRVEPAAATVGVVALLVVITLLQQRFFADRITYDLS